MRIPAAQVGLEVHPVDAHGAEDVVVVPSGAHEGAVLTGTADGTIWRVAHDGSRTERVAHTGGRPLGLELDADGRLLVCDAHRGLLRVDLRDGAIEPVLREVDGTAMVFCNNAAIAEDGTVWFSDSSTRYGIERWKDDFVQDTRTGRLLRLDPDGTVAVVLTGLAFANGVALAPDGSCVVVAETAARTLVRWWITGERAGTRDLLAADLPGYPDNIARGSDGLVWVSIASPRDPVVERLQRGPLWVRRAATSIPQPLQPKPKRTVRVQAYELGRVPGQPGRLVHDLDVDAPGYHMVTGVREHEGRVWLGSLEEPAVAVLQVPGT
ncbi:SMP-30/gluconolactonase/LRE family protein [Nocardioides sp. TRM66260-LWL]|uniref:SMP-30/gluconolactonase/LRE family protein n=1 Tax=Nocardioides sp. TRM66260-LWL TaxID=2874478 RepID=UPI001CC5EB72|nr:SMP-30/gluconolactonase/LRE family protein [Nocardioides sp. TRM66260-LWL]MBZ5733652.1 SMP-30/gluconolactonase/LRE family protein [Nocardioides sp. TRM66260-LWL]